MALRFSERVPAVRRTVSDRLVVIGALLALLVITAIVYGFYRRIRTHREQAEKQRMAMVGTDAARSNRPKMDSERSATPPPAPKPKPVVTKQVGPPASLRPLYTHGSSVSRDEILAQAEAAARGRILQREQAAMDAPTGSTGQAGVAGSAQSLAAAQGRNPLAPEAANPLPQVPLGMPLEEGQGYRSQNDQAGKRRFAEGGEGGGDDYLGTTRVAPISRWVVQRGTVIPASLPSKLVTDLPGDLIGEVVRDVYDSPTQSYVEIPAGSRLVGEYNSSVSYGQNRAQVVWVAVYFPDGSHLDLDRMPSHAADGAVGLKDQTDNHIKRLVGGIALSSLLTAGFQISQNHTNGGSVLTYPSTTQEIGAAVGAEASRVGAQIANRNINIQPTIKIRPGEIFAVSVKKDIVFNGPYVPMGVK